MLSLFYAWKILLPIKTSKTLWRFSQDLLWHETIIWRRKRCDRIYFWMSAWVSVFLWRRAWLTINKKEKKLFLQYFLMGNVTNLLLDLRRSYVNMKFNVVNSDGSNLAADAKVGLVNYFITSLFQQLNFIFNGNLISSSTNSYA